jgi:anti-sigma B factor antagonist
MGTGHKQGERGACPGPDESGSALRLSCRVRRDGGAVVAIRGELDLATADRTVRYVSRVIDRHHGLVSADLSGLAFCDACGLGALIRIAGYAEQAGRRIEFIRPSRTLTRLMRLTGLYGRLVVPAPPLAALA